MLAIYNSSSEFGGVDVLAARFARYLHVAGHRYCVISPTRSRIRGENEDLNFLTVSEANGQSEEISHLLLPSIKALSQDLDLRLRPETPVLGWIVHPNDVFTGFFPFSGVGLRYLRYSATPLLRRLFRSYTRLFDEFFAEMIRRDGLATMDGPTRRTLSYFVGIDEPAHLIPLPAHAAPIAASARSGPFSIGYLGRMDIMKWSAIMGFLDHALAPLAAERTMVLHLVSEGPFLNHVQERCARHGIALVHHGYLPNEAARQLIRDQTDVAVAMGTSALDLAGAGHPCIILDPALSLRTPPQKLFRFVHETDDFSVGEFRDFPRYVPGLRSFAACCSPELLRQAAEAGPAYVAHNHDPTRVFATLLNIVRTSDLRFGDLMIHTTRLRQRFAAVKRSPLRAAAMSWPAGRE